MQNQIPKKEKIKVLLPTRRLLWVDVFLENTSKTCTNFHNNINIPGVKTFPTILFKFWFEFDSSLSSCPDLFCFIIFYFCCISDFLTAPIGFAGQTLKLKKYHSLFYHSMDNHIPIRPNRSLLLCRQTSKRSWLDVVFDENNST